MSINGTDDVGESDRPDRYAELSISDEEFVIYDRENHQAWLQSSVAVTLDNYC